MTGKIFLDDNDMYTTYGVFALRGSYNDLMRLPDFKEPSSYSWHNEDGEDVDLRNRMVTGRDITLTLLLSGTTMSEMFVYRNLLFVALRADGWRDLYIEIFNRHFKLYYKSCESARFINGSKKRIQLVLKFRLGVNESPTGDIEIDVH